MISRRERLVQVQRLCNEVSEVFIDGTYKCGAKSFIKCTIYMDYAIDILYLFGFVFCLENQFTIACGVLQYVMVIPLAACMYVEIIHEL